MNIMGSYSLSINDMNRVIQVIGASMYNNQAKTAHYTLKVRPQHLKITKVLGSNNKDEKQPEQSLTQKSPLPKINYAKNKKGKVAESYATIFQKVIDNEIGVNLDLVI